MLQKYHWTLLLRVVADLTTALWMARPPEEDT